MKNKGKNRHQTYNREEFPYDAALKYRINFIVIVISVLALFLSIFLIYLGVVWHNNNTVTEIFPKEEWSSIISEIIIAIGSTIFSIASISLLWEVWVRRSWLEEMRTHIFRTLSSPRLLNNYVPEWQLEMNHQLMTNLSEPNVGNLINKQFRDDLFSVSKKRKNFNYEVVLGPATEETLKTQFYRATFILKWTARIEDIALGKVTVRVLFNEDCTISDDYYRVLESYDSDIYRYIFLTKHEDKFSNSNNLDLPKALEITKHEIDFKRDKYEFTVADNSDNLNVFELSLSEENQKTLKDSKDEECEILLEIQTYVDKDYPFLSMLFGYTIDTFTTKLTILDKEIGGVNMIPFFNSSNQFKVDGLGKSEESSYAYGHINGYSIPSSSLVYVWRKK